jgi:hypothetical protein
MLQPFHIVVCDPGLLLVRAPNAHWRDLQDAFPDYKTSLGPFDLDSALEALFDEWPELEERESELRAFAHDETASVFDFEQPPEQGRLNAAYPTGRRRD